MQSERDSTLDQIEMLSKASAEEVRKLLVNGPENIESKEKGGEATTASKRNFDEHDNEERRSKKK